MHVCMYLFKNIVYGAVGGVEICVIKNLQPEDKIYLTELVFQNYLRGIHTYIRPVGYVLGNGNPEDGTNSDKSYPLGATYVYVCAVS